MGRKICPHCGVENHESRTRCVECGEPLRQASPLFDASGGFTYMDVLSDYGIRVMRFWRGE